MRFSRTILIVVSVAIAAASGNAAADVQAAETDHGFQVLFSQRNDARAAAEQILKQMDDAVANPGLLQSLYAEGGVALKSRYTLPAFVTRMRQARLPLGVSTKRAFHGVDGGFKSLPNIVAGRYVIVKFDTAYKNVAGTYTEQVTLEQVAGTAAWKYVEYYSAPEK